MTELTPPQQNLLPRELIISRLSELIRAMGIRATIDEGVVGDTTTFTLRTHDARLLLGEDGKRLAALNHIARRIIEREVQQVEHFLIDVNDYHRKRFEALRDTARMGAQRVRYFKKEVELEPMTAFERRIIHLVLQEYTDLLTESAGESPKRRVVIKPN